MKLKYTWISPQLHIQLVDVLKADVSQPGCAGAEIFQVQVQVDVLVATVTEDDVADFLRNRTTAGVEGSEERVEHRAKSLCAEGASYKTMMIFLISIFLLNIT